MTKIAVDLTPLLPGGDNGGAKAFTLALLRALLALDRDDAWLLLTQAASHEELASLEGAKAKRACIVGDAAGSARGAAYSIARRATALLPDAAREGIGRRGYALNVAMKRRGAGDLLRREGVQLLFCPFTSPALREPGIPAVCTLYDLQFRQWPQLFAPEDRGQRAAAFEDARDHAAALAAISSFTREAAIAAGADAARVRVIPIRLPRALPAAADPAVMRRVGVHAGEYLFYPANFWPHKNHARLFQAFARAAELGLPPSTRLVCTGALAERERVARSIPPAVAGRVVFAGFVPDAELGQLLLQARALVFPSLHEGFGIPVAEAMAFGVPVACSGTSALPEVAGDAALFFDPVDVEAMARSLVALTVDEPLRQRLVAAGRARAMGQGDAAAMAREYRALFDACA